MIPMRAVLTAWCAALLVLAPDAAFAQDAPPVTSVLAELAAAPDQPGEYKASVALHVRLRVFPFIRMTLHGDSWYKRPGLYRFVFRGVPLIARAFSDMKYDLGDPAHWSDRYEIAYAPESTSAAPVLRLTPKTPLLVKSLDVALDPARGRILRAVWSRKDGGVITLVQTYAPVAGHAFVAKQVATITLPRMKAELEADYADFDTSEASVATAP
jgi:outer membrane lipoprotein-sorting protein